MHALQLTAYPINLVTIVSIEWHQEYIVSGMHVCHCICIHACACVCVYVCVAVCVYVCVIMLNIAIVVIV